MSYSRACRGPLDRRGFTLVELLVVIAIIGVLVALLLPAVQAAREAANRMSCGNNLKQLGIAMHNHHDTLKRFPPGAASDDAPFGTGGGWGSSWMVFILPYIEQNSIYDKWQFTGNSGYTNAPNNTLVTNVIIPAYRCASTPVDEIMAARGGAAGRLMNVSYTGIAGSVITTVPPLTDIQAVGCCNGSGPQQTRNGILVRATKNRFASIIDGSSNTWMIGEQSAHLKDVNGIPVTAGFLSGVGNSAGRYGWTMGAGVATTATTWADGRHFNCTSVKWQINQKNFANAASTGTNDDVGNNFPLSSAHPGGVQCCMGDGSVQFATNSTDLLVISARCTKANGEAIGGP